MKAGSCSESDMKKSEVHLVFVIILDRKKEMQILYILYSDGYLN